jgi:hypothetical protein
MIIKNEDGTVSNVEDTTQVVETFTVEQLPEIETELINTMNAILDIDNFKQRRLDNLNNRITELNEYKRLLGGE